MRVTITDEKTGRSFEVEVYPENTPNEIIEMLVKEGYIQPAPSGYYWVLALQGEELDPYTPIVRQGVLDGAELSLAPVPIPATSTKQ